MAPEYAFDGLFSIKSDVFSFGILVLEIISGKKSRGFHHDNNGLTLIGHVKLPKTFNIGPIRFHVTLNTLFFFFLSFFLGMDIAEGRQST